MFERCPVIVQGVGDPPVQHQGADVVRCPGDHFGGQNEGVLGTVLLQQKTGQIGLGRREVGGDVERLAECLFRLLPLAGLGQGGAEDVEQARVRLGLAQPGAQDFRRLVWLAALDQTHAQVDQRIGLARFDLQRLAETRLGRFVVAQRHQDRAAMGVDHRIARRQHGRPLDQAQTFVRPLGLVQQQAQQVEGLGLVGFQGQNPAVQRFGLGNVAALMRPLRRLEHLGGGRLSGARGLAAGYEVGQGAFGRLAGSGHDGGLVGVAGAVEYREEGRRLNRFKLH